MFLPSESEISKWPPPERRTSAIDTVVDAYRAHYLVIPGETGNWYSINHTTTVYLHDKQGKVRYRFLYEETPEQLAEQIRKYL